MTLSFHLQPEFYFKFQYRKVKSCSLEKEVQMHCLCVKTKCVNSKALPRTQNGPFYRVDICQASVTNNRYRQWWPRSSLTLILQLSKEKAIQYPLCAPFSLMVSPSDPPSVAFMRVALFIIAISDWIFRGHTAGRLAPCWGPSVQIQTMVYSSSMTWGKLLMPPCLSFPTFARGRGIILLQGCDTE